MDLRYIYDVDGNIVTCFDGADSYTYDFANRLKSWTYQGNTVQYDYDASGNLKNPHGKTLTFNAANEIEGFTYDDTGNLLKDDRYQYTWDGEGRLLSVKDVNGNEVASFTYRPDGLRETKTVNGVTYHYHYDGTNLIRITNDNRQTVWAFTWASGKPNTVTNQNGNTFYYVTNYRGDVVRMVDENGATVANYSYDPWGKVLSVSENAAVAGQPLGYAGYYYDRETKLYYLQARYYDPETARFISRDRDPGDKDNPVTQNAYTYADDNPVMLVDPDGKFAISIDRIKYALKYGLKGWLASYFDWATADKIVAGSVAIADKIYKIATEIAKGYKAGKAINTVFREALNKILIGRGYKNQILNIVKKQARKIGTKVVLRRITTLSFWWTDLALFTGYTIVSYNKYRK
ncbi:RHS repeat-associated core domain protein [Anoxybacillus sp. B7M1]|uniref:RHS repeat domain-containing protein n=1 Tax=unclassified Anoxybacillus TaxID=2639704 RepID=UPI0007B58E0D|nr:MULTISPECIES: RHS repeat-associated core domain-containing protein [unclassified Anoxybacillus]ANB57545.1 RHS repeat-associated core domain protein [Anoxybacillus sp. B2M1]ANB64845.1 RHS repeat-associated core domain protein [Anoxybacillus sp. B7M1]